MVLGCFFVDDKCICSYNILLERYTDIPQESVKKIYFERNAGRCLGERMYKRVVAVLAAISVAFFSSTTVIADEVSDYGTDADIVLVEETDIPDADIEATESSVEEITYDIQTAGEYHMKADTISGENIETFTILRPDPEALKDNVVYASQFGLSTSNEDNYQAFQDALNYCRNNPNTHLKIDTGVYYFRTDAILELEGGNNILIDGNGAEFIFQTQKQFCFDGCDGVEIRDLIVDWNWAEDRLASLVRIRNKCDTSFEIEFLDHDNVDADLHIMSFQQYDSREFVPGNHGQYKTFAPGEVPESIESIEKIDTNVLKVNINNLFTTSFHNNEVYCMRYYTYGGAVFYVNGGSSNITFDNVRIYGAAGMGYIISEKANHFQIINSYIGLRPGNENNQKMSTTVDGIHILNTDGFFRIDNCDLSFTGDDLINIHDDMFKVSEVNDERTVLTGFVTGGFVKKGDKIRFYNGDIEDIGFETEVVNFVRSSDAATLTLKDPVPAEVAKGYLVYRSSSSTHNYVVSNNYFHETRSRAVLLKASDALFENNRLYRIVSRSVEIQMDISELETQHWYEGTGSHNVVVRNNYFEDCDFGGKGPVIKIESDKGTSTNIHSDVYIEDNKFYYCFGSLITADNITDLYIRNNYISDCGAIEIGAHCGAVYNQNNTFVYPSATCPHTDTMQVYNRPANCFEYGNTGNTYCNQCHTIIADAYWGLTPLKHEDYAVERIDVEPTCTEPGSASKICSLCGTVIETGILVPATGHFYVEVIASNGTSASHKCAGCGITGTHNTSGNGGSCTICGHGKAAEVSFMSLEITSNTESSTGAVQSNSAKMAYIGINLYIDAPNGTVFYVDGVMTEPVKVDENGRFKIQYKCAPKELADVHILKAKDSTGKMINISNKSEYSYSGDMYCRYVVEAGSEYSDELKNVCKCLIEYSEQARNYFQYNNSGLVIGNVSATLPTKNYAMTTKGKFPNGAGYLGSSLILGDEVILRHYFMGDCERFFMKCTDITKKTVVPVTVERMDSMYAFYVDIKVPYANIGDMYDLKVSYVGNAEAINIGYGFLTYTYMAKNMNANSSLVNLCNALYNFSSAVASYK